MRTSTGADFDLDASAIMLAGTGKVASDSHFVFFNNLRNPEGSVEHTGDNFTGGGEGDDEVIPVSIYDAQTRGQNFGQVRNAFIRFVNQAGVCHQLSITAPKPEMVERPGRCTPNRCPQTSGRSCCPPLGTYSAESWRSTPNPASSSPPTGGSTSGW